MRRHALPILLVWLVLLLPVALSACGGVDEETGKPAAPDAESARKPADEDPADPAKIDEPPPEVDAEPYLARVRAAAERAESAETRDEALRSKQEMRLAYSAALRDGVGEDVAARILPDLEKLTDEILDLDTPLKGVVFTHDVKATETLWHLCNKVYPKKGAHLEPQFVCHLNGFREPSRMRAGMQLHVPIGAFVMVVEKRSFRMRVFYGDAFVKEYDVGLGKDDRTPEGEFTIETKLVKPTWTSPDNQVVKYGDPRNPLGSRWLGFKNSRRAWGYGIHGTDEPESIGRQSSNGCIRMLDADVRELFSWVPRGAKVVIRR